MGSPHKICPPAESASDIPIPSHILRSQVEIPRGASLTFSGITEFSVAKDTQQNHYAVYTLVVRSDAAVPPSWKVYRRYQEFRNLSDALRQEGFRVPVLPPKKLIGTLDPDFLAERQVRRPHQV